jgi:hypothetical protein
MTDRGWVALLAVFVAIGTPGSFALLVFEQWCAAGALAAATLVLVLWRWREQARATVPPHEYSDRGFAHWPPVGGGYGAEVKVYESSAAAGPHLWVTVAAECHLESPVRERPGISHGVALGEASAHLDMDGARRVRDQLDAAIRHSEARFA